jgi:parallel beta-helix repeat protein
MKIKFHLLVFFVCFNCFSILNAQTTYYVDQQNGNDSNNGTTTTTAFENFDQAESNVSAGDTIEIIGTYTNASYNANYSYTAEDDAHLWHAENTIRIHNLNGTAGNYITIKAHDDNTVLKGDGANIFRVTNSSYLKIENFNIEGEVTKIPLSTAHALQFVYIIDNGNLVGTTTAPAAVDIRFRNEDETNDNDNVVEESDNYTDISNENVKRPSYIDTRGLYISGSNNIIITNNTIHHTPGGGLRVSDGKFIDILENEIFRCSAKSYSGTHALVVTRTQPISTLGYSINILRNIIHHNYNEQFSWAPDKTIITPRIDEGKGISLQRNNTSTWINGTGRILVANNLCYYNGFSGIHSNDGHRIDFINNTCYLNSYTNSITYAGTSQKGNNIGISAQSSNDIKMINNISVIDTDWGGFALAAGNTSNLEVSDNIIFGFNGSVNQDNDITNVDVNTIITNPLFVNSGNHLLETFHDFSLQLDSPAIGAANTTYAPANDLNGTSRDTNPDLGAIEYGSTLNIQSLNKIEVKMYPNPTTDFLYVTYDNTSQTNVFEIYNLLGKRVKSVPLSNLNTENTLKIDVSNLANGFYILKSAASEFKFLKN